MDEGPPERLITVLHYEYRWRAYSKPRKMCPAASQELCSSMVLGLPDIALVGKSPRRLWLPKIAGSSSARRQRRLRITPTPGQGSATAKRR